MEPRRPRKACDLCYTRRIKCDRQEPRCSNCVTYAVDCTHTAVSRKKKHKAQRDSGAEGTEEIQSLQAKVQRLETEPAQLRGKARVRNQAQKLRNTTTTARVEDRPAEGPDHTRGLLTLPPLQQGMAMVGVFLNTLNSVLPLFHADTLLRLVGECYALHPRQRDPVIWAAINVVFALANQQVPKGIRDGASSYQSDETTEYLNKAQSVISDIVLSETRLINVQTLVGMVMVLQTAHNLKPSLILISATMRLVHQLGLHNHVVSAHLDPVQRRQHARVFWLAYILDKDLSLRAQQPSFQLDDDIDVELPSSWPMTNDDNDNTAGVVVTVDRTARMNYFLARVKLAKIEGHIYDCLYSTRALNRSLEERRTARENITTAIYEWQASIPPEFGAAVVILNTRDKPAHKGFFFVLHSSSLQCMTLINRAHAWDGQWVSGLRDHSRGIQPLQLPPGWERLVYQARDFMLLFRELWSRDVWFRWMTSCAYTSAMVLLAANNLYNTRHDRFKQEIELIDGALLWLNEAMRESQSKEIEILRDTCVEAVRTVKRKHAKDIPMSNWQRLVD